jgi:hypothetical protein
MGTFEDDDLEFGDETTEPTDTVQAPVEVEAVETEPLAGVKERLLGDAEKAVEVSADAVAEKAAADAEKANKAQAAAEATEKREAALTELGTLIDSHATDSGERGRDVSTGDLAEVQVQEILTAYSELDLPGKNAAKKLAQDRLTACILGAPTDTTGTAMQVARSLSLVLHALQNAATKSPRPQVTKEPVDPTGPFVERATALYLAVSLMVPGKGVSADWQTKVTELAETLKGDVERYQEWLNSTAEDKGDAPEVNDVVLAAARLAEGKVTKARAPKAAGTGTARPSTPRDPNSPQRSITRHIAEAFRGKAVGDELTMAQISTFSSVEYGGEKVSQGAVSAKMWKKDASGTQVQDNRVGAWVEGVEADESGPKRFRLVAEVPAEV